jgi:basic membrane protein A
MDSIRTARFSRRTAAIMGASVLSAACFLSAMAGCDKKESGTPSAAAPAATPAASADQPMTVGFVYTGSEHDFGYNQAAAEAANQLKSDTSLKIVEQENVPETNDCAKAMESMIQEDGDKAIFSTSYGFYNPFTIDEAKKNPSVFFFHCGGQYKPGETPENIATYFGYIDECEYLSGIVAGHATKSHKLGFIAAKPIPAVLRDINAFELGAQKADPSVTTTVIFTGDWFQPGKEAEATNSLVTQGCDVITMHVDSPKTIIETAAKAKVYVCGYHSDGTSVAPDYYLTGAEWNWIVPDTALIAMAKAGKITDHTLRGGLKEGYVKMSPYGPAVSADAKKDAEDIKAKFLSPEGYVIFKGPLKDNTGKEIYPAGETHIQTDPALEGMHYLVAGVIGQIPS